MPLILHPGLILVAIVARIILLLKIVFERMDILLIFQHIEEVGEVEAHMAKEIWEEGVIKFVLTVELLVIL